MRGRKKSKIIISCENCGKEFQIHPYQQLTRKFCSSKCYHISTRTTKKLPPNTTCLQCGKPIYRKPSRLKKGFRYCSRECSGLSKRGKLPSNYKGGSIDKRGYKYICVSGKKLSEHRVIMESRLQRKLTRNEDVHHIDGNKSNNDINNLILLTKSKHTKLHADLKRDYR